MLGLAAAWVGSGPKPGVRICCFRQEVSIDVGNWRNPRQLAGWRTEASVTLRLLPCRYWKPGQPNSFGGDQDCGEILQDASGVGMWNDDFCSSDQMWVCEK